MTAISIPDQAALQVQRIPLEQLHASLNNPRRTMNEADLAELAASIREIGITVPLLVRPIDLDCMSGEPLPGEAKVGDAYEIVCGHRRSEAATLAGLTSVPCIVRNLDHEEAALLALTDNLQRVDVPPLEEADAFGELLDRLGSIPAVAAKVGKEQSYVAKRLKLRELTTWSCMALTEQLITIDHALLLARLADVEQNEALKWCLDRNAGSKTPVDKVIQSRIDTRKKREKHYYGAWEPETVQRLKEHIEGSSGVKLERAPWPMEEDYLLPDAGSCLDCEKNTKANAPLFGDLAIGEPTCTDGACFKDKTTAWVDIKLRDAGQDLKAKQKEYVPRLSWKFSAVKPATCFNDITAAGAMSTTADPSKVLKAGQWIEAKKNSCPNVRTGITVDWSDANDRGYMGDRDKKLRKPGEVLQVCIAAGCKVHPKAWEKAEKQAQSSAAPRGESEAERKAREEKREQAEAVENQLRMGWARQAVNAVKKLPEVAIREALVECIENFCYDSDDAIEKHLFPKLRKTIETAEFTGTQFAQAVAVIHIARHGLTLEGYQPDPKDQRDDYIKAVKQLGTDPSEAWAPKKAVPAKKAATAKKAILSKEAKKRIADAQKKRWAAARKGAKK